MKSINFMIKVCYIYTTLILHEISLFVQNSELVFLDIEQVQRISEFLSEQRGKWCGKIDSRRPQLPSDQSLQVGIGAESLDFSENFEEVKKLA